MSFTAPAVCKKGVKFGRSTEEDQAKMYRVIDHLFEATRGGKKNLRFLAELIQKVIDGQDEFGPTEFKFVGVSGRHSVQGVPAHLMFGGEQLFGDIIVHGTDGGERPEVGEKCKISDLSWKHEDGYRSSVHSLEANCKFDFAKSHFQSIENIHNGHCFAECAHMIRRAEVRLLGAEEFFSCLVLMDKWPTFWKDHFNFKKGGNGNNVIVFAGTEVSAFVNRMKYYLGFRMIHSEKGLDSLCVPALYPIEADLGIGYERFHFAVQSE